MPKLTEEQKAERALKRRRTEALKAEAQTLRHEAKRREWAEQDMYLTREEAQAGALCRGCGLPAVDNLGERPPLMHLTDQECAEYDAAEAAYQAAHPDCGTYSWSISGSRTRHCGLCCPPLRLPEAALEEVRRLPDSIPANRARELDTWALLLACDHPIERTQHYTHQHWSSGSTAHCPDCDATRGHRDFRADHYCCNPGTRCREPEENRSRESPPGGRQSRSPSASCQKEGGRNRSRRVRVMQRDAHANRLSG